MDSVRSLKAQLLAKFNAGLRHPVGAGYFVKFLFQSVVLDDNEFIGNIGDGTSKIRIYAIESNSAAHTRINNISILHRNVKECIHSTRTNGNPSDRPRWNETEKTTPSRPNGEHFAFMLQDLGRTFQDVAPNLRELSQVLKADEKFYDSEKCEKQRRTLQNNFDTVRYVAPLCVNLTKLSVNIGKPKSLIELAE